MNKILAISGKKGSGKSTFTNYICSLKFGHLNFNVSDGHIYYLGKKREARQDLIGYEKTLFIHSLADNLKHIMMNVLLLSPQQCYGSEEQKNQPTKYRWEDMPLRIEGKNGYMSTRELMQYVGTELFRRMKHGIWTRASIHKIQEVGSSLSIIDDCRFPDEVEIVQENGGKVIRLTRNVYHDNHTSETELDHDKLDWAKFDAVIDNQNMNIEESCRELNRILREWKYI
jgi:uncharacterized protein YqiB (DUF1249 family)